MSVTSIAASGMLAAQQRLNVVARNIANASVRPTDDEAAAAFAALRADQVEVSGGGTAVNVSAAPAGTETDLASEAVQLTIASYTLAANANVMRAAAKMQKSVIDILA
jgi:flagellar basal body rod protein FlgC